MVRRTVETAQIPRQTASCLHFRYANRFSPPNDLRTCYTPWSVFQDGSNRWSTFTPRTALQQANSQLAMNNNKPHATY